MAGKEKKIQDIFKSKRLLNQYVALGGDLSILTREQIAAIPQEFINQYVASGNNCYLLTPEQLAKVPREFIIEHLINSRSFEGLKYFAPFEGLQEIINKMVLKGCDMRYLTQDQRERVPNRYIENYLDLNGEVQWLTPKQIQSLSQDRINEMVMNRKNILNVLTDEQIKNIPQEYINKRVENGLDLIGSSSKKSFSKKQIRKVPQECINKGFAKGVGRRFLELLSKKQRRDISQEYINQGVLNNGSLFEISDKQIEETEQESINKRIANGGNFHGITEEQREAIPQECINQYICNGGSLSSLKESEIDAIPQDIINQEVSKRSWEYFDEAKVLSKEQMAAIPSELKDATPDMIEAISHYTNGEIKSAEIPNSVFANYKTRAALLSVVKSKFVNFYDEKCAELGAVPQELKEEFDNKMKDIEAEFTQRQNEFFKEHTKKVENVKKEIDGWEF